MQGYKVNNIAEAEPVDKVSHRSGDNEPCAPGENLGLVLRLQVIEKKEKQNYNRHCCQKISLPLKNSKGCASILQIRKIEKVLDDRNVLLSHERIDRPNLRYSVQDKTDDDDNIDHTYLQISFVLTMISLSVSISMV